MIFLEITDKSLSYTFAEVYRHFYLQSILNSRDWNTYHSSSACYPLILQTTRHLLAQTVRQAQTQTIKNHKISTKVQFPKFLPLR